MHDAEDGTDQLAATILVRSAKVDHGAIYGPVLVTCTEQHPDLIAYPAIPLSQDGIVSLVKAEELTKLGLGRFEAEEV